MRNKNMPSKNKPLYFWARIDYWIREAFANEASMAYRVVNDIIVFLIFFSIASIVAASVDTFYAAH